MSRVAVGVAADAALRYGYERHATDWRELLDAAAVHVVSVVVANALHREMVEALLAAGKHVLCEKPLADGLQSARAMAAAAADLMARTGAAGWDMDRPAEFSVLRQLRGDGLGGFNRVLVGPAHPYLRGGLPMDLPGVSYGVGDLFGFQARPGRTGTVTRASGGPPRPPRRPVAVPAPGASAVGAGLGRRRPLRPVGLPVDLAAGEPAIEDLLRLGLPVTAALIRHQPNERDLLRGSG